MTLKKLLMIFLISASVLSGAANADSNIVTFSFTGSVIYSEPSLNAPTDSLVSGSFSYDLNAPVSPISPSFYSYYNYTAPNALEVNFSGHTITSDTIGYTLYDNTNGNVEDYFVLSVG